MTTFRKVPTKRRGSEDEIFYPALDYFVECVTQEDRKRIQKLKSIVSERTNIRLHPSTYDDYYLRCLRCTKNDVNRAAQLYIRFCQLRTSSIPGIMEVSLPSLHMKSFYRNQQLSIIKPRDPSGRAIMIWRTEKWDPKVVSCKQLLAACMIMLDELSSSIEVQYNGVIFISDQKGCGVAHVRAWTMDCVQAFSRMLQDAYPLNFIGVHMINVGMAANVIVSIFKKCLSENFRNKFHVHGYDHSSLHQFVHPKILPKFLGGYLSDNDYADMDIVNRLEHKDEFYKDFFKYGSKK